MEDHYQDTDLEQIDVNCQCNHIAHTMRFNLDKNGKEYDPDIRVELILNPHLGFFKRLKVALKYILRPRWSAWYYEDVILPRKQVERLHRQIQMYRVICAFKDKARSVKVSKGIK